MIIIIMWIRGADPEPLLNNIRVDSRKIERMEFFFSQKKSFSLFTLTLMITEGSGHKGYRNECRVIEKRREIFEESWWCAELDFFKNVRSYTDITTHHNENDDLWMSSMWAEGREWHDIRSAYEEKNYWWWLLFEVMENEWKKKESRKRRTQASKFNSPFAPLVINIKQQQQQQQYHHHPPSHVPSTWLRFSSLWIPNVQKFRASGGEITLNKRDNWCLILIIILLFFSLFTPDDKDDALKI